MSHTNRQRESSQPEIEIPPTEDLMREHGILKRLLLIYEDAGKRLLGYKPLEPQITYPVILQSATIARNFIENYHQELEEKYLFKRFLKEQIQVDLVRTLQEQHDAAINLTSLILQSVSQGDQYMQSRQYLAHLLSLYKQMYEPHEAWEDTVLFPTFREIVTPAELQALGEKFEKIEETMFGKNGFQRILKQVEQLEKAFGIYELSQFTPHFTNKQ
ncbi:hemerythrin domain-containing protein [Bacillus sp. RG28]|uniref:Hemerythrin domain-containing protein n=1 Tax=Gottfriedia endophytica TaxID=2820819 RepID=A0A940NLJ1_9BACI|nr:hemerythrin domain-containing protein [Gottfriedia endophytica]MBP0726447.1 hemerythrin domain-containing protein [Gottfriedia endophytica]